MVFSKKKKQPKSKKASDPFFKTKGKTKRKKVGDPVTDKDIFFYLWPEGWSINPKSALNADDAMDEDDDLFGDDDDDAACGFVGYQ